jgi:hypothetical protein
MTQVVSLRVYKASEFGPQWFLTLPTTPSCYYTSLPYPDKSTESHSPYPLLCDSEYQNIDSPQLVPVQRCALKP